MNARRLLRLRRAITAVAALVLLPLALPAFSVAVWLDNVGRAQEAPRPRQGAIWGIWWWYGYHGIYQLDWALKRRRAARDATT